MNPQTEHVDFFLEMITWWEQSQVSVENAGGIVGISAERQQEEDTTAAAALGGAGFKWSGGGMRGDEWHTGGGGGGVWRSRGGGVTLLLSGDTAGENLW